MFAAPAGRVLNAEKMTRFSIKFHCPKFLQVFLLIILASSKLPAQTNGVPRASLVNHYLIVVETSRAMENRARGVFDAMTNLLDSAFGGQLRQGDLIELWTFNDTLHADRFPPRAWSRATHMSLAASLNDFLEAQSYTKRARFERVMPEISRLISESEFLTVILISSGEGTVSGTPFDGPLNQSFKQWHDPQQKARMPLVTMLRAAHGTVRHWSVTPAPWPLEMPSLPAELQLAQQNTNKSSEFVRPPQFSATPPSPAPVVQTSKQTTNRETPPSAKATNRPPLKSESQAQSRPPVQSKAPQANSIEPSVPPSLIAPAENRAVENNTGTRPESTPSVPNPVPQPSVKMIPEIVRSPAQLQTNSSIPTLAASNSIPPTETSSKLPELKPAVVSPPAPVAVAEPSQVPKAPEGNQTLEPDRPINKNDAENLPQSNSELTTLGYLRENGIWLVLLIIACGAGLFCLGLWLRTYSRPKLDLLPSQFLGRPDAAPASEQSSESAEPPPAIASNSTGEELDQTP
jgi:hypothetical protein